MRAFVAKAALFLVAGLLSACASHLPPEVVATFEGAPPVQVEGVPNYVQDELQCGPASLAMVLNWGGADVSPEQLRPQIYSPEREGTLQPVMVAAVRHYGFAAYELRGWEALYRELSAGTPVIVLENLALSWFPRWHYSVVTGFDPETRTLVLHAGEAETLRVKLTTFLRTWGRSGSWALLAMPPERLPDSLPPLETLAGLAALEKAGKSDAALPGYQAAVRRWPTQLQAYIGLANTRYNGGDRQGAAEALTQAGRIAPSSGIVWNNLAHVLHEMGQRDKALMAARKAVALGGPLKKAFEATLQEILSAP